MKHDALHRRARRVHSRAQVRRWEYRQRDLAKGTWVRLCRLLADARLAFIVSEEDAAMLSAEGVAAEPVGAELQPPKTIQLVPEARARSLPSHREVTVRLGPELLGARQVVLCRFTDAD
jgi:hypothetical protein